jgi:DNA repair protein RadC
MLSIHINQQHPMSIQHWPKNERPRERLIQQGAQSLSDAELLAIFLRTGLPGKSAVELAREMIVQFGGLQNLNQISLKEWKTIKGLGDAKFAQLKACLEMAKRCLSSELASNEPILNSPERFEQFARLHIGLSPVENFLAIALNSQLKVLEHKILFTGTVNKAAVFPREVVKFALDANASCVMVAHNHPSNHCTPSQADDQLTQSLFKALQLMDIELIDHLVVGRTCTHSYRNTHHPPFNHG